MPPAIIFFKHNADSLQYEQGLFTRFSFVSFLLTSFARCIRTSCVLLLLTSCQIGFPFYLLLLSPFLSGATVSASLSQWSGRTFYVSQLEGSDSHTVQEAQDSRTPWKSLRRVSELFNEVSRALGSGDTILLQRGGVYRGTLDLTSRRDVLENITISNYGNLYLPLPRIVGAVVVSAASHDAVTASLPDAEAEAAVGTITETGEDWKEVLEVSLQSALGNKQEIKKPKPRVAQTLYMDQQVQPMTRFPDVSVNISMAMMKLSGDNQAYPWLGESFLHFSSCHGDVYQLNFVVHDSMFTRAAAATHAVSDGGSYWSGAQFIFRSSPTTYSRGLVKNVTMTPGSDPSQYSTMSSTGPSSMDSKNGNEFGSGSGYGSAQGVYVTVTDIEGPLPLARMCAEGGVGGGFFIQGVKGELNEPGEWAFNPYTSMLYVLRDRDSVQATESSTIYTMQEEKTTSEEKARKEEEKGVIEVTVHDKGIAVSRTRFFTVQGIQVEKFSAVGIGTVPNTFSEDEDNYGFRIIDSTIEGIDGTCIMLRAAKSMIERTYVSNCGKIGIDLAGNENVVSWSTVKNVGLRPDLLVGSPAGLLGRPTAVNLQISNNIFWKMGGAALANLPRGSKVENNYITDTFLLLTMEEPLLGIGSVMASGEVMVSHNIIIRSFGNDDSLTKGWTTPLDAALRGTTNASSSAHEAQDNYSPTTGSRISQSKRHLTSFMTPCIFMGEQARGSVVIKNTLAHCRFAVFSKGAAGMRIEGNVIFDSGSPAMQVIGGQSNIVEGNILYLVEGQTRFFGESLSPDQPSSESLSSASSSSGSQSSSSAVISSLAVEGGVTYIGNMLCSPYSTDAVIMFREMARGRESSNDVCKIRPKVTGRYQYTSNNLINSTWEAVAEDKQEPGLDLGSNSDSSSSSATGLVKHLENTWLVYPDNVVATVVGANQHCAGPCLKITPMSFESSHTIRIIAAANVAFDAGEQYLIRFEIAMENHSGWAVIQPGHGEYNMSPFNDDGYTILEHVYREDSANGSVQNIELFLSRNSTVYVRSGTAHRVKPSTLPRDRLLVNAQARTQDFHLNPDEVNYKVDGEKVNGSVVTLQPWSSTILYREIADMFPTSQPRTDSWPTSYSLEKLDDQSSGRLDVVGLQPIPVRELNHLAEADVLPTLEGPGTQPGDNMLFQVVEPPSVSLLPELFNATEQLSVTPTSSSSPLEGHLEGIPSPPEAATPPALPPAVSLPPEGLLPVDELPATSSEITPALSPTDAPPTPPAPPLPPASPPPPLSPTLPASPPPAPPYNPPPGPVSIPEEWPPGDRTPSPQTPKSPNDTIPPDEGIDAPPTLLNIGPVEAPSSTPEDSTDEPEKCKAKAGKSYSSGAAAGIGFVCALVVIAAFFSGLSLGRGVWKISCLQVQQRGKFSPSIIGPDPQRQGSASTIDTKGNRQVVAPSGHDHPRARQSKDGDDFAVALNPAYDAPSASRIDLA